jgi:hypothetical protein
MMVFPAKLGIPTTKYSGQKQIVIKTNVRTSALVPDGCDTRHYLFSSPFNSFIYTEAWVEFLCEKFKDLNEFKHVRKN